MKRVTSSRGCTLLCVLTITLSVLVVQDVFAAVGFNGYIPGGFQLFYDNGNRFIVDQELSEYNGITPNPQTLPLAMSGVLEPGSYEVAARAEGFFTPGFSSFNFDLSLGAQATFVLATRGVNVQAHPQMTPIGDGLDGAGLYQKTLSDSSTIAFAQVSQSSSIGSMEASGYGSQFHRGSYNNGGGGASADTGFRWFFSVPVSTSYTLTGSLTSQFMTSGNGSSQNNPILPDTGDNGTFGFNGAGPGWIDPPTASSYHYAMTAGSKFTQIVDFPTGFSSPFTVSVGSTILGQFVPGQSVDFTSFPGGGVSAFDVSGINPLVDPLNPFGFSIDLKYNTPTASFTAAATPEPVALALLPSLTLLLTRRRRLPRQSRIERQ